MSKTPIYAGLGDRIKAIQDDEFNKVLAARAEGNEEMLENETQCEDSHEVETFGSLEPEEFAHALRRINSGEIPQHEPGAKLDNGKPRMGLVLGGFKNALTEVAKVGTAGANKYSDNGWLSVPDGEARYTDALMRHLLADEEIDPDFGLLHKAHTAWNALAVLQLELNKQKLPKETI